MKRLRTLVIALIAVFALALSSLFAAYEADQIRNKIFVLMSPSSVPVGATGMSCSQEAAWQLQNLEDGHFVTKPFSPTEIAEYKSAFCTLKTALEAAKNGTGTAADVVAAQGGYLAANGKINGHLTGHTVELPSTIHSVQTWLDTIKASSGPAFQTFTVKLGKLRCLVPSNNSNETQDPSDCHQEYVLVGMNFQVTIWDDLRYLSQDVGTPFDGYSISRDCGVAGLKLNNLAAGFNCPMVGIAWSRTLPDGEVQAMGMDELALTNYDWYTFMKVPVGKTQNF